MYEENYSAYRQNLLIVDGGILCQILASGGQCIQARKILLINMFKGTTL